MFGIKQVIHILICFKRELRGPLGWWFECWSWTWLAVFQ